MSDLIAVDDELGEAGEGAPAWVAQEDGLLSAAHDSRTMNHQIWKVESDRTAGPLWTGDYVYFLGEGAEGPRRQGRRLQHLRLRRWRWLRAHSQGGDRPRLPGG